ncbi:R3H domain-containing protein 1 [Ricinus communis]|uniref:R3h domain containing protein, putative n=1 Tax=Ricinus communis TaxID=3988 RepID=B9S6G5_RICCO|nr:R3H domain-containing protein 1 [Ricinus communis]EEF40855.1 r3h domain containing protein, putative [Ricinus communis]|eukprot:XP_002521584.1 R3H domain-containing protein 1 [Ricinus communis]
MESTQAITDKESMVDPFLVEALQNPRHRLTILRMELDIQRFLQNPVQQQFEFQHFPTSYLRLAAHRVAQHYGLITMVQDNSFDGLVNKILVKKTAEIRYPAVRLCEIPAKQWESDKSEQVKIVIRPRPNKGSTNEFNEFGVKQDPVRSVEERKEEYDRARARIFSSPSSTNLDDVVSQGSIDRKSTNPSKDELENCRYSANDPEKNINPRDGAPSRVAIFRDREKDRTDPDYDRSYDRYIRSLPTNQSFNLAPLNMQKIQLPFIPYDTGFPQLGQMPRTQNSLSYQPAASPVMSPFCAVGSNQTSRDPAYVQWPSASMMYAHSYEQFRHAVFQAPFCQQPLSFEYSQNH